MSGSSGAHPPVGQGSCLARILLRRRTTGAASLRRRSHGARALARTRRSPPPSRTRSRGRYGAARRPRHVRARRGTEPRTAVAPHAVARCRPARRGPRRRERRRPDGRRSRVRLHQLPPKRRLPVAHRGPPHPHAVQQRRQVPCRRPGPPGRQARHGLARHHRPRLGHARQDRCGQGQPGHQGGPRRVRGHPRLPGPGVEHPGRRARHGVRAPRQQRGLRPQAVRDRLRRQRQERLRLHARQRGARRRGPGLPLRPGETAQGQGRADARQPPGAARCRLPARDPRLARREPGESPDRRRLRGRARPPGRRSARPARPGASTTTTRAPTRIPATRWRATAPGAASTG